MGHDQPYIAAALIALNEDEDLFVVPDLPRPIKYSEATEAITRIDQRVADGHATVGHRSRWDRGGP